MSEVVSKKELRTIKERKKEWKEAIKRTLIGLIIINIPIIFMYIIWFQEPFVMIFYFILQIILSFVIIIAGIIGKYLNEGLNYD